MSFKVVWTKRAVKELLAIPKKQRLMVLKWVQDNLQACANPKAVAQSKAIQGTQNGWRYRVGSYRILARIGENELVIEVVRASHRQGI